MGFRDDIAVPPDIDGSPITPLAYNAAIHSIILLTRRIKRAAFIKDTLSDHLLNTYRIV